MNLITSAHAISLYPVTTLIDKVNVSKNLDNPDHLPGVTKYAERGFRVAEAIDGDTAAHCIAQRIRILGDQYCWTVRHSVGPDSFLFHESWSMDVSLDKRGFQMEFDCFIERQFNAQRCIDVGVSRYIRSSRIGW